VILDSDERKRLRVPVTSDVNLAGATAVLKVDDVAYPLTWTDTPTGEVLTRPAETATWFAGPGVPVGSLGGATVLTAGVHLTDLIVTIGSAIASSNPGLIVVRP
jgi:hypothetical protein